jgi:hypothetical protein
MAVARIAAALETLREQSALVCVSPQPDSHWCLNVSGIDSPVSVAALGVYCTGLIAQVVRVDLSLSDALLGRTDVFRDRLNAMVVRAVGNSNAIDETFRTKQRDPWITEALGHLLFGMTKDEPNDCLPGGIEALTLPHLQVREQGLDLVGVFAVDGTPGIAVGESKASETGAGSQLARAVELFRALEDQERDEDILQALNLMSGYLPAALVEKLPAAIWDGDRVYCPVLTFRVNFDPSTNRPDGIGAIALTSDRKRVVAMRLATYRNFFDSVADAMRSAIEDY